MAYGVVFTDGHVALRWSSDHPATSVWESLEDMLAVHGHGTATSVEWLDSAADALDARPAAGLATPPPPPPPDAMFEETRFEETRFEEARPAHRPAHAQTSVLTEAPPEAVDVRVPPQRRPGRHRRAMPEQESRSTQPIESDRR